MSHEIPSTGVEQKEAHPIAARAAEFAEEETELIPEPSSREEQERPARSRRLQMIILGTVLAGALAVPRAEAGEYHPRRDQIVYEVGNMIEAMQSIRTAEANREYVELQERYHRIVVQIDMIQDDVRSGSILNPSRTRELEQEAGAKIRVLFRELEELKEDIEKARKKLQKRELAGVGIRILRGILQR